jgi:hypothetical protein
MSRIVTSTYRYKRPPRKRKPRTIEAPAIVTIDPKTRVAKKGRRPIGGAAARTEENTPPAFGSATATQELHPPTIRDNLSVLTVRDRKTVERQREQQQAMLLPIQGEEAVGDHHPAHHAQLIRYHPRGSHAPSRCSRRAVARTRPPRARW